MLSSLSLWLFCIYFVAAIKYLIIIRIMCSIFRKEDAISWRIYNQFLQWQSDGYFIYNLVNYLFNYFIQIKRLILFAK